MARITSSKQGKSIRRQGDVGRTRTFFPKAAEEPKERKKVVQESAAVKKIKESGQNVEKKLASLKKRESKSSKRNSGAHRSSSRELRLYTNASILGYRRSMVNQYPNQSLLRIEGVTSKKDTQFYLGKRVAYIYKGQTKRKVTGLQGKERGMGVKFTRTRVIWGRISKAHGSSGVVRARFQKNLTPRAMGDRVRVMLYPSRI